MLALAAPVAAAGCTVVSIEADREARERRSEGFDANRYVDRIWVSRVVPQLERSAVAYPELDRAIQAGLDAAGAAHGRKAGEGAAWAFVTRGEGVVTAIDTGSRAGSVELTVADVPDGRVRIQTGPVIVETAIRDSLAFVSFNDFNDQIAYADVGRSLTRHALAATAPQLRGLAVGDRVRFLGAFNLAEAGAPVRITAVALDRAGGR